MMGLETTAGQSSSTVAEMYDPANLQVRADVRLEDVPMVTRGQPVEIETASSSDVIHGRVLQATSSANIQKNTLEVKIELFDPPTTVSPEMLVTATFLAPQTAKSTAESSETQRMFAPSSLVQIGEGGSVVWIVDSNDSARKKTVEVGKPNSNGLIEIKSGLRATDKLIAGGTTDLKEGSQVIVTGDDQVLGIE